VDSFKVIFFNGLNCWPGYCFSLRVRIKNKQRNLKMAKLIGKSIIAGVLLSAGSMASAATLSAGGVEWDTTAINGVQGTSGTIQFQQWFSDGTYDVGADGQVIITETSNDAIALGAGGFLTGVGVVNSLSDGRNFFNPSFCQSGPATCELTVAFGGLLAVGVNEFDASNAWLNIYFDDTPDFGISVGSSAYENFEEAQDGNLWASFEFSSFNFDGNGFQSGDVEAYLDIVGGDSDVMDIFDTGSVRDIFLTASSQFNNDVYTNGSTGEFTTVSTPATLGLFGLALFGLGAASRRRTAK